CLCCHLFPPLIHLFFSRSTPVNLALKLSGIRLSRDVYCSDARPSCELPPQGGVRVVFPGRTRVHHTYIDRFPVGKRQFHHQLRRYSSTGCTAAALQAPLLPAPDAAHSRGVRGTARHRSARERFRTQG